MKKVVVCVVTLLLFTINNAFAYNAGNFSSDTKIIAAINLLDRSGEQDVIRNLQRYAIKIKFGDLSMISYNCNKCFAVSTYNEFGTRIIVINNIYKNAPTEQIACLIAHESCHTAQVANLEEETIATQKEAACWTRLKVAGKTYPESRLTKRLDKLSGLYLASDNNNNLVEQKIASNGFYKSQYGF